MPPFGATRDVDCPLCDGFGTMRDYLAADGRPTTCWLCEGWGKVAVPAGQPGRRHDHDGDGKTA